MAGDHDHGASGLEFEEVAAAVAGFAQTEIGRRKTLTSLMTFATKQKDDGDRSVCRALLSETASLMHLERTLMVPLELSSVNSEEALECVVRAGMRGQCSPSQLLEVAKLLECVQRIKKSIKNALRCGDGGVGAGGDKQMPVPQGFTGETMLEPVDRMVGWLPGLPDVSTAIRKCVDDDGFIFDGASKELRDARGKIRELEGKLHRILSSMMPGDGRAGKGNIQKSASGMMLAVAPSDANSMVVMGDAGKGKVYVQPAAASALNQRLTAAMQDEKRAEDAVCRSLSAIVTQNFSDIRDVIGAVEALDFAAARARYSSWIEGSWPVYSDMNAGRGDWDRVASRPGRGEMNVRDGNGDGTSTSAMVHVTDDDPIVQLDRLHHPLLLGRHLRAKRQRRGRGDGAASSTSTDESECTSVPFDVEVPCSARCIVITGSNAGGKTTVLKALGLAVIMSQTGLYVPCSDSARPAIVPWCDRVLTDIGDGQSVVESLSTYSGHLTRIRNILETCTHSSMVLLDELGGGTDPADGAALATSILAALTHTPTGPLDREGAGLTMCTTHTAELATLAFKGDGKYINAAVEVDEDTFIPTYRLLWGLPGRSHALSVASRMLDSAFQPIVDAAKTELGDGVSELTTLLTSIDRTTTAIEEEIKQAATILDEAAAMSAAVRGCRDELAKIRDAEERSALLEVARDAQVVRTKLMERRRDIGAAASRRARERKETEVKERETLAQMKAAAEDAAWVPKPGERVMTKLKKEGIVVKKKKDSVVVKMGPMQMQMQLRDVQRIR